MTTSAGQITGGVDTHLDVHVAAALDERGALLGVESFETTPKGYAQLLAWPESFSAPSSFSASRAPAPMGLGSLVHLHGQGIRVVEVDRPTTNVGAATGSADPEDAISAARAAASPYLRSTVVARFDELRCGRLPARCVRRTNGCLSRSDARDP